MGDVGARLPGGFSSAPDAAAQCPCHPTRQPTPSPAAPAPLLRSCLRWAWTGDGPKPIPDPYPHPPPSSLQLFETGVDEMSWDDLSQGKEGWPSVDEVTEYRCRAYAIIKEVGARALGSRMWGWWRPGLLGMPCHPNCADITGRVGRVVAWLAGHHMPAGREHSRWGCPVHAVVRVPACFSCCPPSGHPRARARSLRGTPA